MVLGGGWIGGCAPVDVQQARAKVERGSPSLVDGEWPAPPGFRAPESIFRLRLEVRNPLPYERRGEPVTFGVPLPCGVVFAGAEGEVPLVLSDSSGKVLPAQYQVLARWPDGSVRWVLVDSRVDVGPGEVRELFLRKGRYQVPASSLRVYETEEAIFAETGKLKLVVRKEHFRLFDDLRVEGLYGRAEVVRGEGGGIWVEDREGRRFGTGYARPRVCRIEEQGPLRAVILVRGGFATADGDRFSPGVAGYTARIYLYDGQDYVRVTFTFENNGRYGFRHEDYKAEPLEFRRVTLELPLAVSGKVAVRGAGFAERLGPEERFYLFQRHELNNPDAEAENFSYFVRCGEEVTDEGKRYPGWVEVSSGDLDVLAAVEYFWQNYPKSIIFWRGNLILGLWPLGGFWPPGNVGWYRLRGGTHKSYDIWLRFHPRAEAGARGKVMAERFFQPLTVVVPAHWYATTQALGWFVPRGGRCEDDPVLQEALERYERLQDCKVHLEASDKTGPPSTIYTERERRGEGMDWYGWMNFGDIPWGGNNWEGAYCSLHYDWTYGMLLQFLRSGDTAFFRLAKEMALHRMDVDQYHTDRGSPWLNNFQWNEFSQHDIDVEPWEPNPSHTWIQGLILYYLLTGERRAYEAALDVGRAIEYYWTHDWGDQRPGSAEIRIQGWSIENLLALYEVTGDKRYLELAKQVYFERTVPFFAPEGYVGDPAEVNIFQLVLAVEPLIKLDRLLGDEDLRDNILRMVDFFINRAYSGGDKDAAGNYRQHVLPLFLNVRTGFRTASAPGFNFMTANAFAYAYVITGEKRFREWARRIFKDAVFYWQEGTGFMDPRRRSPITYAAAQFPGSRSKIHAWISRYPLVFLWEETHPKEDIIPPAPIRDLEATCVRPGEVILDWTATGDDGLEGRATRYQIKYSAGSISSELEWLAATNVKGEPEPGPAGALERFVVRGLESGKRYYFAIRAYDEADNRSKMSNVVRIVVR